jgi:polysaccharide export outer membrane protein
MNPDNTANKAFFLRLRLLILIGYIAIGSIGCKTTKRVSYFQDIPDTLFTKVQILPVSSYTAPAIGPGDVLQVAIYTNDYLHIHDANHETANGISIKVDPKGHMEIPILGKMSVQGFTVSQLQDTLSVRAHKFYKNPVVLVSHTNFTITVLGEVAKPGTFLTNEKISVLDALGLAGDISIYGKKENVLVVRNRDNHKEAIRLNLNSTASFTSPFFYLKTGDIVIIEPNENKIAAARDAGKTRNYALLASGLSVLIILISRLTF